MRLNGRKAILEHLGYSPRNHRAWPKVRAVYGHLIHQLPDKSVWAEASDLDAWDRTRSRLLVHKGTSRRLPKRCQVP